MALLSTDVNAYLTSYGFNPATISAENKSLINKILAGAGGTAGVCALYGNNHPHLQHLQLEYEMERT